MRQLYPQKVNQGETQAGGHVLAATKQMIEDAIKKALLTYLAKFLQLAKPLMSVSDASTNKVEALKKFFSDAGSISIALWTQLRRFELVDLKYVPQRYDEGSQPMPEMTLFEPHAMHTAALEDDKSFLDGKPPLLMTSSGLVACGDSRGDDYTIHCVLKTAVGWFGPN